MTPEERKAWGEKMKAARLAKEQQVEAEQTANNVEETDTEQYSGNHRGEEKVEVSKSQLDALLSRLEKLESASTASTSFDKQTSQVDMTGRMIGVNTPHPLDPKFYIDPRDRLYELPELRRFAFRENYELDFAVEVLNYETKWGTSFSVPKFKLKLKRLLLDEETGEPKVVERDGKRLKQGYLVKVGIFFIDPNDAIKTAVDMGIEVTDANSYEFLEMMRFEQYKRWLVECMKPPKPEATRETKQTVINGTVYSVEEWSELR